DTWDRTSLQLASRKGYSRIAQRLLSAGAVVGRPSWGNDNPLHVACAAGHFETVQALLKQGADSGADDDGEAESPLHNACYNDLDDSRIITVLCLAGAKVDSLDGPEIIDETAGSTDEVSRGAEVSVDDEVESDSSEYEGPLRPLHIAAIEGKPQMARALVEHGASVDPGDSKGKTPLYYACAKGNFDVVDVLVEFGAD
ncbi:ankyrin repeat-containing domain protein, partial [Tirmania nivea]